MTAIESPVGDPRDRAAQVVRHAGRPRRHRPRGRRRHGLRPPRAERRRQDDDGPDPLDPDRSPTAARSQIAGHDVAREPDAVRAVIGVTGQFSAVDELFTGEENLQLMADLRHLGKAEGRRRVDELLERFDLVEAAKKPVATYSGGMRRRLDLAMTLIGEPRIIFLDEPTAGLDPRSRRVMWEIIRDLVAGGVTIFLTTQYLDEADRLAHRIAVLDHGRPGRRGDARRAQAAGVRAATSGSRSPTPPSSSGPPAHSTARPATTRP